MLQILQYVGAFLLAIGVLVVVHEFGHYWVARRCGVKVLRFSVGFGKPLWTRMGPDGTEFVLAAIPVGGYVKMVGEDDEDVSPEDRARSLNSRPIWQRMAIVLAGPVANFILAIFLFWVAYLVGVPDYRPVLGEVPAVSLASQSGLRQGDQILRLDGRTVAGWQDLNLMLVDAAADRRTVAMDVQRASGEKTTLNLPLASLVASQVDERIVSRLGLTLDRYQRAVTQVDPLSPAGKAGIRAGDELVSWNGQPFVAWTDLVRWIQAHPDEPLVLTVTRADQVYGTRLTIGRRETSKGPIGFTGLGYSHDRDHRRSLEQDVRYPPGQAFVHAMIQTRDTAVLSVKILWRILQGLVSPKNISGVITMAEVAGKSLDAGAVYFVMTMASFSMALGVMNLLPIPVLDGGLLMYYTVELVSGRPIPRKAMEMAQWIGLGILMMLMALALYNDVSRHLGH